MVTMGRVAYKSPFDLPPIFAVPGGAVGSWGTAAKVIGAAGLAATATYALFGSKTNQVQSSQIDQKADAIAKPFYTIDIKPGGVANLYGAGGTPTVSQTAKTDQTQTVPPPTDYMQIILIGALAIGGLLVLNKFGGKK